MEDVKKLPHVYIVLFALVTTFTILAISFIARIPLTEENYRLAHMVNNSIVPFITIFIAAFILHYINKKGKLGIENTFFMVVFGGLSFHVLLGILGFITFTPLLLAAAVGLMTALFYAYRLLARRIKG